MLMIGFVFFHTPPRVLLSNLSMQLLGKMPKKISNAGRYSKNYFKRNGDLKHIAELKFWGLDEVLQEKYNFPKADAIQIQDFLTKCLQYVYYWVPCY